MVEFLKYVKMGWENARNVLILGLILLTVSLLNITEIMAVLTFSGFHIGIQLGFPVSIIDLWAFVSTPSSGGIFGEIAFIGNLLFYLLLSIIFIFIKSFLAAGYLGSLNEYSETKEFSFIANGKQYFFDILFFQLLMWLISFSIILFIPLSIFFPLVITWFLFFIVLHYFFYGIPFIIITNNWGFKQSVEENVAIAIKPNENRRDYFEYGIKYLGFTALLSIPFTLLVVNLKVMGIIIGILIAIPLGLSLNTGTLLFFKDIMAEKNKDL